MEPFDEEIYRALCGLKTDQFEEVLSRVGAPRRFLSGDRASPADRARDLMMIYQQQGEEGMARLKGALKQVSLNFGSDNLHPRYVQLFELGLAASQADRSKFNGAVDPAVHATVMRLANVLTGGLPSAVAYSGIRKYLLSDIDRSWFDLGWYTFPMAISSSQGHSGITQDLFKKLISTCLDASARKFAEEYYKQLEEVASSNLSGAQRTVAVQKAFSELCDKVR